MMELFELEKEPKLELDFELEALFPVLELIIVLVLELIFLCQACANSFGLPASETTCPS